MPRWPEGYVPGKWRNCPGCGGKKDHSARACRKCTPPNRALAGITGPDHPAWKTGRRIDDDGYVRTYATDHPWPRASGYVFEHVRVMELSIGRKLLPGETVHHKDMDKQNNELPNLEIMERGEHSSLHRTLDTHKRTRNSLGQFTSGEEVQNASK